MKLSHFSRIEQLGIILMIAGIILGFYGRIVGPRILSSAKQRYSNRQDETENLSNVKNLVKDITEDMVRGQKALQLEGLGQWWFFSGLGIFIVSRRQRWNMSLQSEEADQEESH